MGNYITTSDLINGLSVKEQAELTGDGNEQTLTDAIADWAITSAESLIDTHICVQVSVPMSPPTGLIKNMALNLAKYYMFLRRHKVYEDLKDEYDHILELLAKMLAGDLPVDVTDVSTESVNYGSEDRLFNENVGI